MSRLEEPVSKQVWESMLKRAAAALRDSGVPFAIMGSIALWARTGKRPATSEDIDFAVRPHDVARAVEALVDTGFRIEVPDEDWLVKAWHAESDESGKERLFIDLIFAPAGIDIDDELFARAELAPVLALEMLVLSATDLMTTKLLALNQQRLDYVPSLEMARILREQIVWDELEQRTSQSPYAEAFFLLARRLGIHPNSSGEMRSARVLQAAGRNNVPPDLRSTVLQHVERAEREQRNRRPGPLLSSRTGRLPDPQVQAVSERAATERRRS